MSAEIEEILDYLEGHLSPDERARFERRVGQDAALRDLTEQCRSLIEALREGELPSAPADVIETVAGMVRTRETSSETVAMLVFDSLSVGGAALAGVRSGASARRLRYRSLSIELDLEIVTHGSEARLRGELTRHGEELRPMADVGVALLGSGHLEREADAGRTDELGTFVLTSGGRAVTALRLDLGSRTIRFDLPPDPS